MRLGKNMDVNVSKMFQFGITCDVFLLAMRGLVQHLHQPRLDHSQFAELVRGQLVQGFRVALENNDNPSLATDGVGVFHEPVLTSVDRRAR